jgi:hypothetical protein
MAEPKHAPSAESGAHADNVASRVSAAADTRSDAPSPRGRFGERRSKSADEARADELARLRAMTPRERMMEALSLGEETDELLARIGRARP